MVSGLGPKMAEQPKRILVTGSRDWDDWETIYRELNRWVTKLGAEYEPDEFGNTMPDPSKIRVVHGACPTGADHWAEQWAISNCSLELCEPHEADWEAHGRAAGPIRNREMVEAGADVVLAFVNRCTRTVDACIRKGPHGSHGAMGTVALAQAAGLELFVVKGKNPDQ